MGDRVSDATSDEESTDGDSDSDGDVLGDDPTYVPTPQRKMTKRSAVAKKTAVQRLSPAPAKRRKCAARVSDATSDEESTDGDSDSDGDVSGDDPTYVPTPQRKMTKRSAVAKKTAVQRLSPAPAKRRKCAASTSAPSTDARAAKRRPLIIQPLLIGKPQLPAGFKWTKEPLPLKQRDVHPDRPLCSHAFQSSDSASDIFLELYKPAFDIWIAATNENGKKMFGKKWVSVTYDEGLRFLSIRIFMNAVALGNVKQYWRNYENLKFSFVTEQMSYFRYIVIRRATNCSIASESEASGASDRNNPNYDQLHKVRPTIDALNIKFRACRAPSDYLSLDEAMIKCQARCPILVSMPNKPINYGMKLFVLAESDTAYIHSFVLYHPNMKNEDQEVLGVTNALVFDILTGVKFSDNVRFVKQGFTIVMDNYYGNVHLAYLLNLWETHVVCTMRANRRDMPRGDLYTCKSSGTDVKIITHDGVPAPRGYSAIRYSNFGGMTLAGWRDNKTVLVLSTDPTYRSQYFIAKRKNKRKNDSRNSIELPQPKIIDLYSRKMSGVDLGDQRIASDHKHRRSRRWYMQVHDQCIEMTLLNTGVFLRERPDGKKKWNAFAIKMNVAQGLRQLADSLDPSPTLPLAVRQQQVQHRRLDCSLHHRPVKMNHHELTRRACVVHKQRRQPVTKCFVCDVPLCVGECWRRYHEDVEYELYDDPLKQHRPVFHKFAKR